ncbi:sulfite oxidase [Evansella tamaricis]|uniref:Sulfite oxidase n=1 Tax=Evansella tamaricis TaxID=2069301 RepID=A0ABS6JJQ0_9BACI|nr:sulfite oxidase [Evansella tamaricis]MBU9713424.1 sulfite oxidase [Evansella tamaricis]
MGKQSSRPFLMTRNLHPEVQESPIHFLKKNIISNEFFYIRNHFPYPNIHQGNFEVTIEGNVMYPYHFHLAQLRQLPSVTIDLVLECAGNKRSKFSPKVHGEQWEDGAIHQGSWRGVPLKDLLAITGIGQGAKEVLFTGHDMGEKGKSPHASFSRSLPIEKALHPDTIIAYECNGKEIPYKHGAPIRLIVPGWYAMASVKWLKSIAVINHRFDGPFQTDDYVYYPHQNSKEDSFPVTKINVNSTIQKPLNYSKLKRGENLVRGIAWSGNGPISKIEISYDNGVTWEKAIKEKNGVTSFYAWESWTYLWNIDKPGEYVILSKATDSTGSQPLEPFWNQKGYGYNAVHRTHVKVE